MSLPEIKLISKEIKGTKYIKCIFAFLPVWIPENYIEGDEESSFAVVGFFSFLLNFPFLNHLFFDLGTVNEGFFILYFYEGDSYISRFITYFNVRFRYNSSVK